MKPELKLNNKNGGRKEAQVYCAAFLLVLVRSGGRFPLEQLKCFAGGGHRPNGSIGSISNKWWEVD